MPIMQPLPLAVSSESVAAAEAVDGPQASDKCEEARGPSGEICSDLAQGIYFVWAC